MIYLKMGDVTGGKSPGPSKLWIFLDEREDCVNWGNFGTYIAGYPGIPTSLQSRLPVCRGYPGMLPQSLGGFFIRRWSFRAAPVAGRAHHASHALPGGLVDGSYHLVPV